MDAQFSAGLENAEGGDAVGKMLYKIYECVASKQYVGMQCKIFGKNWGCQLNARKGVIEIDGMLPCPFGNPYQVIGQRIAVPEIAEKCS